MKCERCSNMLIYKMAFSEQLIKEVMEQDSIIEPEDITVI